MITGDPRVSREIAEMMEAMKNDLLIVFLRRLGCHLTLPVTEIDDVKGIGLTLRPDTTGKTLTFDLLDADGQRLRSERAYGDGFELASTIKVSCCEHGTISILLHRPDGSVFAVAAMVPDIARILAEDIVQKIATVDADTIGNCEGHA